MLQQMFPRSSVKYARSPLARELGGFFEWLIKVGYSKANIRGHLQRTHRVLGCSKSIRPGAARHREKIHLAFSRCCTSWERSKNFRGTERAYCRFLHSRGWLIEDASPWDPMDLLLRRYARYLEEVRGFTASTAQQHLRTTSEFLARSLRPAKPVRALTREHVERYLAEKSKGLSRQSMQHVVAHLRAFLRYGYAKGLVRRGLDVIDTPRTYRDELPPRAMPWPLVKKMLRSVERSGKTGWRDYMILHLMAYYGLRPSEIATLRVDSIDWKAKTCRVEQRKTQSDLILPLSDRTLTLLRRYLCHRRAESGLPQLFVRARRPTGSLHNYAVCEVYYKRAAQSGLNLQGYSPYCLRHSFAMRLFQRRVGVKAIGDLLGHRSLEATCVYLRLDTPMLRTVALPLPHGRQLEGRHV
jgi:integrase/recombinase XerD